MKHPPSPSPPYWFWFAAVAGLALLASLTIAARHSAVADDHASGLPLDSTPSLDWHRLLCRQATVLSPLQVAETRNEHNPLPLHLIFLTVPASRASPSARQNSNSPIFPLEGLLSPRPQARPQP